MATTDDDKHVEKKGNEAVPLSFDATQLELYLKAMRPWSFSASVIPAVLGMVLSYKETGAFSLCVCALTLLIVVATHAAGNLVNTYYDFLRGVDSESSDDKTLTKRLLHPKQVVQLSALSYMIGFLSFAVLLFISPARLEIMALLFFGGLSGSYFYTGSLGLKYYALGDCLVLLIFGPACVVSAYTVQCGRISLYPAIYVMPIVLNTEAILHGNNSRDRQSDRRAGILTLAIILGRRLSYLLFFLLLFVPYFIIVALTVRLSASFVLPLVTLPYALKLDRDYKSNDLDFIAQNTAKLNLALGSLYILACLVM